MGKMRSHSWRERILKLTPGRDERRLKLIGKGHVELRYGSGPMPGFDQLERWGWLEKHEPVDFLDDYYGYRPTALGLEYLIHDEKYHLILIKKEHVEAVHTRVMKATEVMFEAIMATFFEELQAHPELRMDEPQVQPLRRAIRRYERQGYMTLERFFERNKGLDREQLVVCGIIRYPEFLEEEAATDMDVWPKARHCLRYSKRGQTYLVRPGMEQALLDLCHAEVRLIG